MNQMICMPERPRSAARTSSALRVADDGRWFQVGTRAVVHLAQLEKLRLVLVALVAQRRRAPGVGLAVEEVLAAGWPGEKVIYAAGMARVYTAIYSLRRLGLAGILVRRRGGYLLRPEVSVEISGP
jgi:hypothetical protein